jgi:hypothetical protein
LQASRVLDSTLTAPDLAQQTLHLGGQIGRYNAATGVLQIQGMAVQVPTSIQSSMAAWLLTGNFVGIDVNRVGTSLVVSALTPRGSIGGVNDMGQSVALKAIASGIDWSAMPVVLFKLRGVDVRAPQPAVAASCRQAVAGADLLVEVKGRLVATGNLVLASEVRCSAMGTNTGNLILGRIGSVKLLDLTGKKFTLQTAQGDVPVQWDAQTFFPMEFVKHPESLTGQSVEVEGVSQTGVLRARKVKRSP